MPAYKIKKPDARSLPLEALEAERRKVVRLFDSGMRPKEIMLHSNFSYSALTKIVSRYKAIGEDSIAPQKRGRKGGYGNANSPGLSGKIKAVILMHQPVDWGINSRRWSGRAVAELLRREFSIDVTERSAANYLKEWGLTKPRSQS